MTLRGQAWHDARTRAKQFRKSIAEARAVAEQNREIDDVEFVDLLKYEAMQRENAKLRKALRLAVFDTVGNVFAKGLLISLEKGNKWFGTQGYVVWLERQAARLQQAEAALSQDDKPA